MIENQIQEKINNYIANYHELDDEANEFVDLITKYSNLTEYQKRELFINMKLLLIGKKYNCLLFQQ